jgi:hypothetical protein
VTYLTEIAAEIERELAPELIPDGDTGLLFRLYAVLALVRGQDVGAADVHDAWAAWMSERDPTHAAIRPFDELDAETKAQDDPYVAAIRTVASRRPPRRRGS